MTMKLGVWRGREDLEELGGGDRVAQSILYEKID